MARKATAATKQQVTRLDILTNDTLPEKEVNIPDWGGVVVVRGMTGTEFETWQEAITSRRTGKGKGKVDLKEATAELVIMSTYVPGTDGTLERLFQDSDASVLATKSARALNTIMAAAMELNGLVQKELEELVGN